MSDGVFAGEPGQVRTALAALLRPERRPVAATIALTALATVAGLVGPWLFGRIVDTVQDGGTASSIDRLSLAIVGVAVLQLILNRSARYLGARFGERVSADIREGFLDRVLRLPAAATRKSATGDLLTRGTADIGAVSAAIRDAGPDLGIAAMQAVLVLAAVFLTDPLLGGCAVVCLSGVVVVTRWYTARARTAYLAAGAANSDLAEVLSATVAGARTVELLGLEHQRLQACLAAIDRCRCTRLATLRLRSVLFPALDVSYALPLVAVLLVGGLRYDRGGVSLGAVVAAALYLRQLIGPLETMELWIDQAQSAAASFARVAAIPAVDQPDPDRQPQPNGDRLEAVGVHFGYLPGRDVLHAVDLTVVPGERLAVVGASGAGKTTLGRLVAGIDEPRSGTVTVGGVPVAGLSREQLRRRIGLVTQENHVFACSLRDNLRLARPDASDDELLTALAGVGARWVSGLPDGLATELGGRGVSLDGAQAQQVSLARLILADPHTLVLDEATALLDPRTARSTEQALSAVLTGRTVIAVAHRLHTAHDADRIVVLADGRVTEIGTHAELLAADAGYAALWQTWHGRPTTDPTSAPEPPVV